MTYESAEGIGNQFVVFGYKSIDRTAARVGAFKDLNIAKLEAASNFGGEGLRLHHVGIAKIQHP